MMLIIKPLSDFFDIAAICQNRLTFLHGAEEKHSLTHRSRRGRVKEGERKSVKERKEKGQEVNRQEPRQTDRPTTKKETWELLKITDSVSKTVGTVLWTTFVFINIFSLVFYGKVVSCKNDDIAHNVPFPDAVGYCLMQVKSFWDLGLITRFTVVSSYAKRIVFTLQRGIASICQLNILNLSIQWMHSNFQSIYA